MKYKAIFFDRDGTLTMNDPNMDIELHRRYKELTGIELNLPYERFIKYFKQAQQEEKPYISYKTIEDEALFFTDFYELFLGTGLMISMQRETIRIQNDYYRIETL
ncbi:MAG: hypothetical protein PHW40_04395 [Candidatus Izemoplasmatales bacterium]|nr:hypothetical protein [Candidatus Izemoplasmatales bacterium]